LVDLWNDNTLQTRFPRLFSFARHKNISVAKFLENNTMEAQFYRLSLSKPFKSTKVYKISSKLCRSIQIQTILDTTYGEAKCILPQSSITFPIKIYSHQLPSFGFGIPNVATSSNSFHGCSSWIK
jgi:hypothetical protein